MHKFRSTSFNCVNRYYTSGPSPFDHRLLKNALKLFFNKQFTIRFSSQMFADVSTLNWAKVVPLLTFLL